MKINCIKNTVISWDEKGRRFFGKKIWQRSSQERKMWWWSDKVQKKVLENKETRKKVGMPCYEQDGETVMSASKEPERQLRR